MNFASDSTESQIKCGIDLLRFVANYPPPMWIYRGQLETDVSWPLLPKAGRPPFDNPQSRVENAPQTFQHLPDDIEWFHDWRDKAVAFSKSVPEKDEFECLAYAQHYGLATRLLDWTENPLAAFFFAAESHPCHDAADGAIFAYTSNNHIDRALGIMEQAEKDPNVALFRPRPFDPRILCQSGLFTFHPEPHVPLTIGGKDKVVKAVIPSGAKGQIQYWLNTMGVSKKTLFPDLEGLSSSINWWYTHLRAGRKFEGT